MSVDTLTSQAMTIWRAGVSAVQPAALIGRAVQPCRVGLRIGPTDFAGGPGERLLVVGAGKASAAMARALVELVEQRWNADFVQAKVDGWVNVPADTIPADPSCRPRNVVLHPARDTPANLPTAAGVAGSRRIREIVASAGPTDTVVCLISGGGSALLPEPVAGISLEAKQAVTQLLAGCGASIVEINAVRKHLSAIKGGRLAEGFTGRALISLILSDVIGDPLDVVASGPTAPDGSTYADALEVLDRYRLTGRVPSEVLTVLREGFVGRRPETPKSLPTNVHNVLVGSADIALRAAAASAERAGFRVVELGPFVAGETREVAAVAAGVVRSIRDRGRPVAPPACVLIGGETTVTLGHNPGLGGRNQEFALAAGVALTAGVGAVGLNRLCVLSGGTDGEDGPTTAAGAWVDATVWRRAELLGLRPCEFLTRHDAYRFFEPLGSLWVTGPTGTNVMDLRVLLVGEPETG